MGSLRFDDTRRAHRVRVSGTTLNRSSSMKNAFEDWSGIRIFLAVFRRGSTLAASRELGMSQPTVARRIDALEHELGLPLFERDTRGVRPTENAKSLLPLAEAVEAAILGLAAEAERARRPNSRPIRITAPRLNFSPLFSTIIADFSAEHPGTRFEFIASYELLDLCAGEADVAIRITRRVTDDRLICTKLTDVTSSLYASRAYAQMYGLPKSPADFVGHSFAIYDPTPGSMLLNTWLLERIAPEQVVFRSADAESVNAAIVAGFGIGPVPTSLALDYPTLVRCFEPPDGTNVSSWLVIGPDAYRRPEVRTFAKFFAPRFRAAYKALRSRADSA